MAVTGYQSMQETAGLVELPIRDDSIEAYLERIHDRQQHAAMILDRLLPSLNIEGVAPGANPTRIIDRLERMQELANQIDNDAARIEELLGARI